MNEYDAGHLRPGQGLFFESEVYGEVISLLDGWVKIIWEDSTTTDLHVSDFAGITRYEGPPRQRAAVAAPEPTRPASSYRSSQRESYH
jgi:hypothetical protein